MLTPNQLKALTAAAEVFREYEEHHRKKWEDEGRPEKAERNRTFAIMMEEAIAEDRPEINGAIKYVPEDVRTPPECHYEETPPTKQRLQNHSQLHNADLAQRAVELVAPHWSPTVRNACAHDVRALLDKHLTRMWVDIVDFHQRFGLQYTGEPRMLPKELADFRLIFLAEEFTEYKEAVESPDSLESREQALDALVDLVYVALGTAYLHGFNFAEAWRRVQKANMAKVRTERAGDSKRGSTFDVIKPPGWTAPSHRDLVGTIRDTIEPQVQHNLF